MIDDLQNLWNEKTDLEKIEAIEVKEEDFIPATTIEDYNKANPDKATSEVLIHIEL